MDTPLPLKWLVTDENVDERDFPSVVTELMMATAINAAIKPYSSAVTPRSSRFIAASRAMNLARVAPSE